MTKSQRVQVDAINQYLSNMGLGKGTFIDGKNHAKFVYTDDVIGKITCTIACTPRDLESSTKQALSSFKRVFRKRISDLSKM